LLSKEKKIVNQPKLSGTIVRVKTLIIRYTVSLTKHDSVNEQVSTGHT